jgi:hypothetical protein
MPARNLILAAALAGFLTTAARAQTTNAFYPPPFTKLEAMEDSIGTMVVKSAAPVGTVTTANGSTAGVTCKVDQDGNGLRQYGIAIRLSAMNNGALSGASAPFIDYDEIDGLLQAITQLEKIDWDITPLSSFNASYETRGGFRVAAFSSRRSGAVEISVTCTHANMAPILLAQDQIVQLQSFIQQAQTKLTALMKP